MGREYDLSKIAFKGEKKFLSNMHPAPIVFDELAEEISLPPFNYDGKTYPSSEHLYQALKSDSLEWKEMVLATESGEKVKTLARKHLGKTYPMREDWEDVKLNAMRIAVTLKFDQNRELKDKLSEIKGEITEENCWGDTFWGTVDGVGENHLGKILMSYRDKDKIIKSAIEQTPSEYPKFKL